MRVSSAVEVTSKSGTFTRPLRHQRDGRRFTITDDFAFHVHIPANPLRRNWRGGTVHVHVPVGAFGDGASVPPWIAPAIGYASILLAWSGHPVWGLIIFTVALTIGHPYGALFKGAVLHDWLYNVKTATVVWSATGAVEELELPRWVVDRVMRHAAKVDSQQSANWKSTGHGGRTLRWAIRWTAWATLLLAGGFAFRNSDHRRIGRRIDQKVVAEVNDVLHRMTE